ncbi:hypothetical protein ASE86_04150 [Sphingomonas sp. Leaf33]|nr:hypothetical protein ASE86_04150 [Sphingomonas sp. Leaf33]
MADDFDILRAAWNSDQPSEAEVVASQRLWRRAVWKTRAWNALESIVLLALSLYLATWIFGERTWHAAMMAAAMVALLWWSQRKRYRLRGEELGTGDPERVTLLDRERGRVRARLIRNSLAIGLIVPLFALGFVMARLGRVGGVRPSDGQWWSSPAVKWLALALLTCVLIRLATAWLRDRRAIVYLADLAEEYRAEYRRDQPSAP